MTVVCISWLSRSRYWKNDLRPRRCGRLENVHIFRAGTKRADGEIKTAGGRVLAVTALGRTIEAARARAYEAVSRISFENCHYRRDIALSADTGTIDQSS